MAGNLQLRSIPWFEGIGGDLLERLSPQADVVTLPAGATLVRQHDEARWLFFLLSGDISFRVRVDGADELLVGVARRLGDPVGWSALHAPYRYGATIRADSESRLLRLPAAPLRALLREHPEAARLLLGRTVATVATRLEQVRVHLTRTHPVPRPPAPVIHPDPAQVERLPKSPFLAGFGPEDRGWLAARGRPLVLGDDQQLFAPGEGADRFYLLLGGRVELWAAAETPLVLRTLDEPGEVLGWSCLIPPRRYRVGATVRGMAWLLVFEGEELEVRSEQRPPFGAALMAGLLDVLARRLAAARVRLIASRFDRESTAVRALLDQHAEVLPVTSPLLKLPLYLEHRLTLSDAFDCLERAAASPRAAEREVASLCRELLCRVRDELHFYQGLQAVYEHVAGAPPGTGAELLRLRCTREFARLFEGLSTLIQGEANLPDRPGHLFIMNHLRSHPDNALPNDFHLILDTHFVSALLARHYGKAPVRVVRAAYAGEFMQKHYYDRLGHIVVAAGEPGEPAGERQRRLRAFLEAGRDCLRAGQNVIICPEGAPTTTENSPLPFRIGAFQLAAFTRPEPLIVPVALAGFDRQVTRCPTAVVIHPPFRLSRMVADPRDRDQLKAFARDYRETFRGYVQAAAALVGP